MQDIKALFVTRIRKWWCYYYAFISPNILREKVHRLPHRLQHLTARTGSFVYGAATHAHVKFDRRFRHVRPLAVRLVPPKCSRYSILAVVFDMHYFRCQWRPCPLHLDYS